MSRCSSAVSVKPFIIKNKPQSISTKMVIKLKPPIEQQEVTRPVSKLSTNLDSHRSRPSSRYSFIDTSRFNRSNSRQFIPNISELEKSPIHSRNVSIMDIITKNDKDQVMKEYSHRDKKQENQGECSKSFMCNNEAFTSMLKVRYDSMRRKSTTKICK
jgi:hypothetical protein